MAGQGDFMTADEAAFKQKGKKVRASTAPG